jgi:hypothetical protein
MTIAVNKEIANIRKLQTSQSLSIKLKEIISLPDPREDIKEAIYNQIENQMK